MPKTRVHTTDELHSAANQLLKDQTLTNCRIASLSQLLSTLEDLETVHGTPPTHELTFIKCDFIRTNLDAANIPASLALYATECTFDGGLTFSSSQSVTASISPLAYLVTLERCTIKKLLSKHSSANTPSLSLLGCKLNDAEISGLFCNDQFVGCEQKSTKFRRCDFTSATLMHCYVDRDTEFNRCKVDNTQIDRITLKSLRDYGGLTSRDLESLDIRDDFTLLRQSMGGLFGWVYMAFAVAFFSPYVFFLIQQYSMSHLFPPDSDEPTTWLIVALLFFITNGGENWNQGFHPNWLSILTFLLSLAYHGNRISLFLHTKKLEHNEEVRGFPAPYTLEGKWKKSYVFNKKGFRWFLLVTGLNILIFLFLKIPLNASLF